MSSTFSRCGSSGSATDGVCCGGAQPSRRDDSGTVGLIESTEVGHNHAAVAAIQKKKYREHRAAEPDALTVDEAIQRGPAGKGKLYQEIAAGRLLARKIGRRTVILRTDYERWLNALPTLAGVIPPHRVADLKVASAPPRRRGRPRKTEQQSAMADGSAPSSRHCELCADEGSK